MNGREVVDAVKRDVENFFRPGCGFELKVIFLGNRNLCRGKGIDTKILLDSALADFEIESPDSLTFVLLTVGHETAHYLNCHNNHQDSNSTETRSLEEWADFYGTKVAMYLITFGESTTALCKRFPEYMSQANRLQSIGRAIGMLSKTYFDTSSSKYGSPLYRVGTCVSGVLSFLDTYWNSKDLARSLAIWKTLHSNPDLTSLIEAYDGENIGNELSVESTVRIHQEIQGKNPEISSGMKNLPALFLGTNYDVSPLQRAAYVLEVRAELQRQSEKLYGEDGPRFTFDVPAFE